MITVSLEESLDTRQAIEAATVERTTFCSA